MTELFHAVLKASFQGSIVILAVIALRFLLKKAPKSFFCLLWLLAGLRLVLPFEIQSSLSLQPDYNFASQGESEEVEWGPRGEILDKHGNVLVGKPLSGPSALPEENEENLQSESYLYKVEGDAITGPLTWRDIAAKAWLLGMGFMLAASAFSYFRLKRRVREAYLVENGCFECPGLDTAFVLGFLPPKIYLPMGLSEQEKQFIYDHENTHIARHDHWHKLLGYAVLSVHWFNPLVWLGYGLLCRDIELACDEHVVRNMSLDQRKAYSAALLSCGGHTARIAACPVAFGESNPKKRILNVLNYKRPGFWICLLAVAALVFVGVCLLTSPKDKNPMERLSQALEDYRSKGSWHIQAEYTYENRSAATHCEMDIWEEEDHWYRVSTMDLEGGNQQTRGYLSEDDVQYTFFVSGVYHPEYRRWSLAEEDQRWYPYWLPRFELKEEEITQILEEKTEDGSVITTVLDHAAAGEQYTRLEIRWHLDAKGALTHVERYEQFTTTEDGETFLMGIQMDISLVNEAAETVHGVIQGALEEIPENIRQDNSASNEEYLTQCREVLQTVQSRKAVHILEQYAFNGSDLPENGVNRNYFRSGDTWLRIDQHEGDSYVGNLMVNGRFYESTTSNLNFDWQQVDEQADLYPQPWLLTFDPDSADAEVISRQETFDGYALRLMVRQSVDMGWMQAEEYYVDFGFDHGGNFLRAEAHIAQGFSEMTVFMAAPDIGMADVNATIAQYAGDLAVIETETLSGEAALEHCREAMLQLKNSEELYLYVRSPEDPLASPNVYMKAPNGWLFQYQRAGWDYVPVRWLQLGNAQYIYSGDMDEDGMMTAPYYWQTETRPESHNFQLPYPFDLDWENIALTYVQTRQERSSTVIVFQFPDYLDEFTFWFDERGELYSFQIDDSTGEPEAKPILFQTRYPYDTGISEYLALLADEAEAQADRKPTTPDSAVYEELFTRETDGAYTSQWIHDLFTTFYLDPGEFVRQLSTGDWKDRAGEIVTCMGYELEFYAPGYFANVLKQLEADPQTDSEILALLQSIG